MSSVKFEHIFSECKAVCVDYRKRDCGFPLRVINPLFARNHKINIPTANSGRNIANVGIWMVVTLA